MAYMTAEMHLAIEELLEHEWSVSTYVFDEKIINFSIVKKNRLNNEDVMVEIEVDKDGVNVWVPDVHVANVDPAWLYFAYKQAKVLYEHVRKNEGS